MAATTTLALMAAGAASNTIGSYYGARNQRAGLRTQAAVGDANARIAELGAQAELARGEREQQAVRLRTAQLKSRQRAGLAASGVDLGDGSAAEILTSTDYMGEVDAATARDNAIRQAWGYRVQAGDYTSRANMARATASGISPVGSAMTTLVGEAGRVAGTWYALDRAGALGPADVRAANKADDPIYALGSSRGWWSR